METCTFPEPVVTAALPLGTVTGGAFTGTVGYLSGSPISVSLTSIGVGIADTIFLTAPSGLWFPKDCQYSVYWSKNMTLINNLVTSCVGNMSTATLTLTANSSTSTAIAIEALQNPYGGDALNWKFALVGSNGGYANVF